MTFESDITNDRIAIKLVGMKDEIVGRIVNTDREKRFLKLEISEGGITTIGNNGYYWINMDHIICIRNLED